MIDDEFTKKTNKKWEDTVEFLVIMFGILLLVLVITLFFVVVTDDMSFPILDCFFF